MVQRILARRGAAALKSAESSPATRSSLPVFKSDVGASVPLVRFPDLNDADLMMFVPLTPKIDRD
jgi:hypothetical protein